MQWNYHVVSYQKTQKMQVCYVQHQLEFKKKQSIRDDKHPNWQNQNYAQTGLKRYMKQTCRVIFLRKEHILFRSTATL